MKQTPDGFAGEAETIYRKVGMYKPDSIEEGMGIYEADGKRYYRLLKSAEAQRFVYLFLKDLFRLAPVEKIKVKDSRFSRAHEIIASRDVSQLDLYHGLSREERHVLVRAQAIFFAAILHDADNNGKAIDFDNFGVHFLEEGNRGLWSVAEKVTPRSVNDAEAAVLLPLLKEKLLAARNKLFTGGSDAVSHEFTQVCVETGIIDQAQESGPDSQVYRSRMFQSVAPSSAMTLKDFANIFKQRIDMALAECAAEETRRKGGVS